MRGGVVILVALPGDLATEDVHHAAVAEVDRAQAIVELEQEAACGDSGRETADEGLGGSSVTTSGSTSGARGSGRFLYLGLHVHPLVRYMSLNHMVHYSPTRLDASFSALSDATRRGVLEQLGREDASITALAEKFHMTLTGMKKHVGVLEQAGLVTTEKVGRVRTCKLGPGRLEDETAWLERYRQLWDARFDELDKIVSELKQKEMIDGRKSK